MTWKSYAAMSGATVIAGWLASSSTPLPQTGASTTAATPRAPAVTIDISEQAERLRARGHRDPAYVQPRRNPFQFADVAPTRNEPGLGDAATEPAEAEPLPPPGPPPGPTVSLAGIAEDGDERTAIVSSPGGVLLVREGDEILGFYRVLRIEGQAVELQRLDDGTSRRLMLP